ncbi:kp78a-related [Anaeramoeba flamelloides]|uniref:Kp78a-related n=1 Tax=Anaeramoeba flamelloides TaxID=1746091 RepID=A0AAV8A8J3_9EUKA|nr:kp78a-related [Anaeramoeba flamelloides]
MPFDRICYSLISFYFSTLIEKLMLGKTLGSGSFSKVKWAINQKIKQEVAIKIITKNSLLLDSTNMDRVRREIAIQKLINHPNVVKIFDVYETEMHLFLVLEYVSGGELFDYIIDCGRVDSTQSRIFFQQIISGLLQTTCGSPHYVSPEIIKGRGYDGRKSDIWSCGVILYALLCGMHPFNQKDYKELLYNIRKGVFFPKYLGEQEKDLISKMLVVDSEKRITIKEIKRHPWFTFNFPKNYLPPSPPIDYGKGIEKPILLKHIDSGIVQDLSQLGLINGKEIIQQLQPIKKISSRSFISFMKSIPITKRKLKMTKKKRLSKKGIEKNRYQ